MKLVTIILNKTECLEKILEEFSDRDISGATIIDSKGMIQELSGYDDLMFLSSLRNLLNPSHKENKTIFVVTEDDKVSLISKIVNDITGGLDKPDTGILFTVPIDYLEGITH